MALDRLLPDLQGRAQELLGRIHATDPLRRHWLARLTRVLVLVGALAAVDRLSRRVAR